jgi:hypothetical protein
MSEPNFQRVPLRLSEPTSEKEFHKWRVNHASGEYLLRRVNPELGVYYPMRVDHSGWRVSRDLSEPNSRRVPKIESEPRRRKRANRFE